MPHPDNTGWMSLLLGVPVEPSTPATSPDAIPAMREALDLTVNNVDLPSVAEVRTDVILYDDGSRRLGAEVYVPHGDGPFPILVYFHGGAFCIGSAVGVRRPCMRLAAGAAVVVVNVDYSLAPEFPFPYAVEDAVYSCRWATQNAAGMNGDASRIFVAGDSVGANLACVCIHELHGDAPTVDPLDLPAEPITFSGALLHCGLFDMLMAVESPGSHRGVVEVWWHQAYLGPHWLSEHRSPLVSPLRSERLHLFPPTYLAVGSEDSLVSQSLEMAKLLCAADVSVAVSVIPDVDHAFHYVEHKIPELVTAEMEREITWLAQQATRASITGRIPA